MALNGLRRTTGTRPDRLLGNLRASQALLRAAPFEEPGSMNAEACHARAAECAANAALASVESVALEFLKLAAQWRAMAVRDIYLGLVDEFADPPSPPSSRPGVLPA